MLCASPKERRPFLHRGRNLKSRITRSLTILLPGGTKENQRISQTGYQIFEPRLELVYSDIKKVAHYFKTGYENSLSHNSTFVLKNILFKSEFK
jgi:hypothetical protein